ncbi:MAG: hypothetical protein ACXU9O_16180 [Gemmatimonadaceae bacterium]
MASLDSAWLKINRGREHGEAVKKAVECWLRTDAYSISREVDPETGDTVRRAKIKEGPPPRISVLIGDAVQNLRSALDHAVYALAESQLGTLTLEVEEGLMFPIIGNQNRKGQPADGAKLFKDAVARGQLQGVPGKAAGFIEQEQPYHWGNDGYRFHWLWTLHDVNRIDKHRRLALTTAFLDLQFVTTPEGVEPRITFSRAEGPVNDGDPLVTYSGADKGVDAHFTRDVAINEGVAAGYSIDRLLDPIQERVEWMMRVFAQFL